MNARRSNRSLTHAERSLITLLLAALALAFTVTPDANAQDASPRIVAAQYLDAIHGNASSALTDPGAVLHTPEGVFTGAAALSRFGETLEDSFSHLAFDTHSVESVDNLMVIAFTMTGVNTGSYRNLPANCAGVAVPGVAYVELGEAGVVEQWIDYDREAVTGQIAAINQLDPGDRPGCANAVVEQANLATITRPTPVPSSSHRCQSAGECQTP